jgi:hypothetical protein
MIRSEVWMMAATLTASPNRMDINRLAGNVVAVVLIPLALLEVFVEADNNNDDEDD